MIEHPCELSGVGEIGEKLRAQPGSRSVGWEVAHGKEYDQFFIKYGEVQLEWKAAFRAIISAQTNAMLFMTALFRTCLLALLALSLPHPSQAAKVAFISGEPSHGPMQHEHRAGNLLLAKALRDADLGVEAVVLPKDGYPEDPSVLEDADSIVVFCTGYDAHLLNPNLESFDAIMKKGTGVVMIHWATEASMGMPAKKFLEWMGGYCDPSWSVNPHWTPHFKSFPDHPIANGVQPFRLNDEWYYHMRFVPDLKGVTPILSDLPGPETLVREDGPRSGNPDVRRAVANGESQHVAWAYERPDGRGRGFGFTGAHKHVNWRDDNFRKVVLNAILWTAHVKVPENGVASPTPSDEELKQNLDDKSDWKKKQVPTQKKPAAAAVIDRGDPRWKTQPEGFIEVDLEKQRMKGVRGMDARDSLKLLFDALHKTEDAQIQASLLKGISLGLEGRRNFVPPEGWGELSARLGESGDGDVRNFATQVSQIFGDESAIQRAFAVLKDQDAKIEDRRTSLASLVSQQRQDLLPVLEAMLDEKALRLDAIRAVRVVESPQAAAILIDRFSSFDPETQRAAVEALAGRKSHAEALLAALEAKTIPRETVPVYTARTLSDMLGEAFSQKFGVEEPSGDKKALIERYKRLATPSAMAKADASQGRAVYQLVCSSCHKMYDEGGIIGPDLTGSNRADLDYLLLNIIDPSGDIPDSYRMVTVETTDGQVLVGTVVEEDPQKIVINMVGTRKVIGKGDVKSRTVSDVSMMPEGLLQILKEEEVLNLFKYFQTQKQVSLP